MKKGAASRIFCFQQLHILWVLTQNSPLGAALMPPTCTDTWTHRSHGGEDPSWFQWSLVAPCCPRTLLRKEQVRWGIREGKVPSVLLLFLVFYWYDNALPGKGAQSCTQHQPCQPLAPGQGGEVWGMQRNSCCGNGKQRAAACSETISPRQSARRGLGVRQGKGTRCCRAEKTIWMTLGSHPRLLPMCWSAVMLLKSQERT